MESGPQAARAAVSNEHDAGTLGGSARDGDGAILDPHRASARFDLARRPPEPPLAGTVQEFWMTSWDRAGHEPYVVELIPSPSVNVTFKRGRSRVAGVTPGRFTEVLDGCHRVFGVRFRPGAFRGFLSAPVATITGRFLPIEDVFGPAGAALEDQVLAASEIDAMSAIVSSFLAARLPAPDPMAELAADLVAEIVADPELRRVADLADRHGIGVRRLQRVFHEYVGVGPRWVIRRFRLQEAAARAVDDLAADWAGLAAELGYSDQAHLTRDFATMIGTPPQRYRSACAADRNVSAPGRGMLEP